MNKKQLKQENDELRREMRILAMKPDSPEAHVIRMQTVFAKELEESHKTGAPLDIPKLLGLYGKMMNPIPKSGLTDTKRLDTLQKLTYGYGDGWVLRTSRSGRGMRLHETSGPEATPSVRDAIDKYIDISEL